MKKKLFIKCFISFLLEFFIPLIITSIIAPSDIGKYGGLAIVFCFFAISTSIIIEFLLLFFLLFLVGNNTQVNVDNNNFGRFELLKSCYLIFCFIINFSAIYWYYNIDKQGLPSYCTIVSLTFLLTSLFCKIIIKKW